jgi:hypothetical protein
MARDAPPLSLWIDRVWSGSRNGRTFPVLQQWWNSASNSEREAVLYITRSHPLLTMTLFRPFAFPLTTALILSSVLFATTLQAQIVVTPGLDATELVVGIFQGEGVSISNATAIGPVEPGSAGIAGYTADGVDLLPEQGVIMSTGLTEAVGDSAGAMLSFGHDLYENDPDLELLTGADVVNVMALEFDFVPEGDVLRFEFVFASEEYPDFVCDYNDGFGFFLSGPGIHGPFTNGAVNIAVLPGTSTPVTIDNVNNGRGNNGDPDDPNCPPVNPEYYIDNSEGQSVAFNGMTVILPINALVTPEVTYHIKLVIGDAIDTVYDSGIFLQANSFRSVPLSTGMDGAGTEASLRAWIDATGGLRIKCADRIGAFQLLDAQGRVLISGMEPGPEARLDLSDLGPGILVLRTVQGVHRFSK